VDEVLRRHPGVHSADETDAFHEEVFVAATGYPVDPTSFLSSLRDTGRDEADALTSKFRASLAAASGAPDDALLLVDKNPLLTRHLPAIATMVPDAKIVILHRDPRDVCISCFLDPLSINLLTLNFQTLEQTVSYYVSVMDSWLKMRELMPASCYIEVAYEDLVSEPERTLEPIFDFLGLGWSPDYLVPAPDPTDRYARTANYADASQPIHPRHIGRWKRFEKYLQPHMEKLAPYLEALGYSD
jgi:hypothetical protein